MARRPTQTDEISKSAAHFALGAILGHHGFRQQDCAALDAVLEGSISDLARAVMPRLDLKDSPTLGELLHYYIDSDSANLEARGVALEFERRRTAYITDRHKWLESEHNDPLAPWRKRVITKAQRFMIADVCRDLRCAPPRLANRGEAADWLEANGAHPTLRPDSE